MERDPVGVAETADDVDAGRPVALYPLVDRDGVDLHPVPGAEDRGQHLEGDHAVLASGDRHGDPVPRIRADLLPDLLLDALVDVAHEMVGAQVGPVVADEGHRLGPAQVALHSDPSRDLPSRRLSIFSLRTFEGIPGRVIIVVLPPESFRTTVRMTPSFSMSCM